MIVGDGVYYENINFNGRAITVVSENGAANTTINGSGSGNVVTFNSGEGSGSVIEGFTITNGTYGIYNNNSSPVIRGNEIIDNGNHGIYNYAAPWGTASPLIKNNTISRNDTGIYNKTADRGTSSPVIENNLIEANNFYGIYNSSFSYSDFTLSPLIRYNTIRGHEVGIYNTKYSNRTFNRIISRPEDIISRYIIQ